MEGPGLREDLERMRVDGKGADVVLVVEGGAVSLRAHRCILAARSEKFAAMFRPGFREAGDMQVLLPQWPEDVFRAFLR